MARGQVSWSELQLSLDPTPARGQVSWAELRLADTRQGADTGAGLDSGVRSTGQLPRTSSDVGSGIDISNITVSTSTFQKAGTDKGFGFRRYSAAGLVFLFRGGEPLATVGTTVASKNASDSGIGVEVGIQAVADASKHGTDAGVGADSSNFFRLSIARTDTGTGLDTANFIPSAASLPPGVALEVAFDSDPTAETQIYTVVSSDTSGRQLEFSVKRGRQDELKQPETGTMITSLFNQSRSFDPAYTLSPHYPDVLPVKQCRLVATRGSTTYFLFAGDIEQWPQQLEGRMNKATIQANDGFDPLSQVQVTVTRPQETTGARINAILDAAQWPASQRQIDTGQTTLHPNTYTGTALELIRNVVADEDGYFFMQGSGVARFIERHARFKPPYTTPQVVLSTRPVAAVKLPLSDADYQVDKDFIKNQVYVNIEAVIDVDGNNVSDEQKISEEDAASMVQYRPRALTYDKSAIADLNEAVTKAQYHLDRLKDPIVRVRRVVIEPQQDVNLWTHALGREIGDRVGVEIYPVQTGTEEPVYFEGIIEYVEHRYVVKHWQTIWYLSPADRNDYWILGDATLGVLGTTTRLGY